MFHPLPTPFLPSGVNLTKLAPGLVWFFFLKTHSLQNRQKTGIKGYPEPMIWFPRVETNICFRANSTRPKTFLAALWAPKQCSVGEITGNQIVSPFQPSAVASGLQHQHCQSMEMPSRGFFISSQGASALQIFPSHPLEVPDLNGMIAGGFLLQDIIKNNVCT